MSNYYTSLRSFSVVLLVTACCGFASRALAQTTSILSFPTSANQFGYFQDATGDTTSSTPISPGQTSLVFNAVFSATSARNPIYDTSGAWSSPAFYGGYRLVSTDDTTGLYLPNFVRGVTSPASGEGYATLPVSQILAFSQTGTVTNTVSGAFVTPTSIIDGGTYHVDLPGISTTADTSLRGVAFDGTQWLVTADSASIPSTGTTGLDISTTGGWLTFNTTDFSVGGAATLHGPITESGLWFQASKTAQPINATYDLAFSNVTYSRQQHVPDSVNTLVVLSLIVAGMGLAKRRHRAG
ncbi:MAG TPA: hypothetical protein VHE61_23995 [Opitutaceae bacterium]|nr:hypothetical protein [Opitutaceae bacterium]